MISHMIFMNMISELVRYDVKLIALRSSGFNNVIIGHYGILLTGIGVSKHGQQVIFCCSTCTSP